MELTVFPDVRENIEMSEKQHEYYNELFVNKYCPECYIGSKLWDELQQSDLHITIDRYNFIKGWNARGKYNERGELRKSEEVKK